MPTIRADEMGTHCLICYTTPSNIVLIPCNHLCICSECFLRLKENSYQSSVKCPMCRLEVDLKHQIMIIYNRGVLFNLCFLFKYSLSTAFQHILP
jgi:hypothetical protein